MCTSVHITLFAMSNVHCPSTGPYKLHIPPSNSFPQYRTIVLYVPIKVSVDIFGPLNGKKWEVTFTLPILHFVRIKGYCTITVCKCFTSCGCYLAEARLYEHCLSQYLLLCLHLLLLAGLCV
jgi:hypothetical protein